MASDRSKLIRNLVAGGILLSMVVLTLVWLGVFEGVESGSAQVRQLLDNSKSEINDHDWDDFFDLCDLTYEEKQVWLKAVPRQANFLVLDTLSPAGFISVPEGATQYQIEVQYIAHMQLMGRKIQAQSGKATYYFIKKEGKWWIDIKKTITTVPYVTAP